MKDIVRQATGAINKERRSLIGKYNPDPAPGV